jgi:hypothetical protein
VRIVAKGSKEPQQSLKPIIAEPLAKTLHLRCAGKYFLILAEIGVFQQNWAHSRLAALQRKRGFLLGAPDVNGPNRTVT